MLPIRTDGRTNNQQGKIGLLSFWSVNRWVSQLLYLYKSLNLMPQLNWHIQWNEHLALELSYDLGLGCSPLFSNSTDYDSSYPWIRLRFVHLMGVRPVQTYCWKTNVSISLHSPTSDNAMNMSILYWYNTNVFSMVNVDNHSTLLELWKITCWLIVEKKMLNA